MYFFLCLTPLPAILCWMSSMDSCAISFSYFFLRTFIPIDSPSFLLFLDFSPAFELPDFFSHRSPPPLFYRFLGSS